MSKEAYWEKTHEEGYDVFSLTQDQKLRDRIVEELRDLPEGSEILLQGCGSLGILERDLADRLERCSRIVCNDFKHVVKIPEQKNRDVPRVTYNGMDSRNLGEQFPNRFDAVVIVNSVIAETDEENLDILRACREALKPGGRVVGFFPSLLCPLDIAAVSGNSKLGEVDLKKGQVSDPVQGVTETTYTSITLRQVLRKAGYVLDRVEIYYFDSDFFVEQAGKMYDLGDPEVPVYEHLVLAHKPQMSTN